MSVELTPIPDGPGSGVIVPPGTNMALFWRREADQHAEYRRRLRNALMSKFEGLDPTAAVTFLVDVAEAIDSLGSAVAAHPQDWGLYKRDAWIYGIVCGWSPGEDDDPSDNAMTEMVDRHGWDDATRARLARYEDTIERLLAHDDLWPERRQQVAPQ